MVELYFRANSTAKTNDVKGPCVYFAIQLVWSQQKEVSSMTIKQVAAKHMARHKQTCRVWWDRHKPIRVPTEVAR